MVTLIVGLPGSGKSTLAGKLIQNGGLCYDLDAIAGAFRLKAPHDEPWCKYSRAMANDLLIGWSAKAHEYHDNIVIIRVAPSIEEAEELQPDRIVYCNRVWKTRGIDKPYEAIDQIKRIFKWAKMRGVSTKIFFNASPPPG